MVREDVDPVPVSATVRDTVERVDSASERRSSL
jgi:hypothetical protein